MPKPEFFVRLGGGSFRATWRQAARLKEKTWRAGQRPQVSRLVPSCPPTIRIWVALMRMRMLLAYKPARGCTLREVSARCARGSARPAAEAKSCFAHPLITTYKTYFSKPISPLLQCVLLRQCTYATQHDDDHHHREESRGPNWGWTFLANFRAFLARIWRYEICEILCERFTQRRIVFWYENRT